MASVRKRTWKTPSGEPRLAWAVDFADAQGKRQHRQFGSRREADAFRVAIRGQVRGGTYRANSLKLSVLEVADTFLDNCRGRMRRFFEDGLAATRLAQLTARGIADFRDRLRDYGLSIRATRKVLGTLKVMLEYAVEQDFIATRNERRKKGIPPTKEAMRLLLAADPDLRIKFIVAATTGLRAGEFHALRWKHLDFRHAEVSVETRVDAYGEEDVAKTEAGLRTVPLGLHPV